MIYGEVMNTNTRSIIESIDANSKEFVIYNDKTLTSADVREIVAKVAEAPLLDRVTLSACDLTYNQLKPLLLAIAKHPSLTKVDLSENRASAFAHQYAIIQYLAQNNKRVHSLNISKNLGSEITSIEKSAAIFLAPVTVSASLILLDKFAGRFKKRLARFLRTPNSLVVLQSNLNTFYYDVKLPEHLDGAKNIFQENDRYFRDNNTAAEVLVKKILAGNIGEKEDGSYDYSDIRQVNIRLSAILYIAEETGDRENVVKALLKAKAELPADCDSTYDIESYMTRNDAIAAGVTLAELETTKPTKRGLLAVFSPKRGEQRVQILPPLPAIKTSSPGKPIEVPRLGDVTRTLVALSDEDLRQQIRGSSTNPQNLISLGESAISANGDIAFIELQWTTASQSVEAPVRSLANFLEEFTLAKQIVADYAAQAARRAEKGWRIWKSKAPTTTTMRELADAGSKARRAGLILQAAMPTLENMERNLSAQTMLSANVVEAYRLVGQQVTAIQRVGREVLMEWKNDASTQNPHTGTEGHAPLHVQMLSDRLDLLGQVEQEVLNNIAHHVLQAAIDGKQLDGLAKLRAFDVPHLAAQVSKFMRQVSSLQRASLINGLADATRAAHNNDAATTVLAAMETVRAIEALTGSTQQALLDMGRAAEQVSNDIPLQPDAHRPILVVQLDAAQISRSEH